MERTKAIQKLINKLIEKRGEKAVSLIEDKVRGNMSQYTDNQLQDVLEAYNCI